MHYRYVQPPTTFKDQVTDAVEDSGSKARIVSVNRELRTVKLQGDYADILLARRALARIHVAAD